jgi:hypothetical protein
VPLLIKPFGILIVVGRVKALTTTPAKRRRLIYSKERNDNMLGWSNCYVVIV